MMTVSGGTITCGAQCGRGALQGRIIGYSQAPVRAQAGGSAFLKVSIDYAQKFEDFLGAGLMLDEPAVSQPIV